MTDLEPGFIVASGASMLVESLALAVLAYASARVLTRGPRFPLFATLALVFAAIASAPRLLAMSSVGFDVPALVGTVVFKAVFVLIAYPLAAYVERRLSARSA